MTKIDLSNHLRVGRFMYDTHTINGGGVCERAVRHMFRERFQYALNEAPRQAFWDLEAVDFVVEVKRRFCSIKKFPTYRVEARKFEDIEKHRRRQGFDKPTIFVVMFDDAVVAHIIRPLDTYTRIENGIWNRHDRTEEKRDTSFDAFDIPMNEFTDFEPTVAAYFGEHGYD
jgi:hypothetical protein